MSSGTPRCTLRADWPPGLSGLELLLAGGCGGPGPLVLLNRVCCRILGCPAMGLAFTGHHAREQNEGPCASGRAEAITSRLFAHALWPSSPQSCTGAAGDEGYSELRLLDRGLSSSHSGRCAEPLTPKGAGVQGGSRVLGQDSEVPTWFL